MFFLQNTSAYRTGNSGFDTSLAKWEQPYQVFETLCFPAKWKVGRFLEDSNATVNYFRNYRDAQNEANRRNQPLDKNTSAC